MASQKTQHPLAAIVGSLGWPLMWGGAACCVFYMLVFRGPLDSPGMQRYFASHPVTFCATGMFFVGLAALAIKSLGVLGQFITLPRIRLAPRESARQSPGDAAQLLDELGRLPATDSYLSRRLRDALTHVTRTGSADGLEGELKHLSDMDAGRQQDSFALVRIIIWATPMLGFLGTVIGITQALGDLDPQELAASIQTAMDKLLAGLYVAFDTTALALSLSIVLMFLQFLVDRVEAQLLSVVDARADEELVGRFALASAGSDPHVASVGRMMQSVVDGIEQLVARQSHLWSQTIEAAHQHWAEQAVATTEQTRIALGQALDQSMERYVERFDETQRAADDRAVQRWEQWQTLMSTSARAIHAQQAEMVKQGEVMAKIAEATGDVIQLERALNDNLAALAGSKNFEDTVMSLAAAIHLLNTRLGTRQSPPVELGIGNPQERAA